MKPIFKFVSLCALGYSTAAFAGPTFKSGIVSGETWTASGSPFCITGDILVASLNIQPGVEVRFLSNCVFEVGGTLQAEGTAQSPIIFQTTNNSLGWQGIWFRDCPPGSVLVNCIVQGAKSGGVRITNSIPAITNCVFANNSTPGNGGGLDAVIVSGDFVVESCTITNNRAYGAGGGINIQIGNGNAILKSSLVASNQGSVGGGGIRIALATGDASLSSCTVTNNRGADGGGIYASLSSGTLEMTGCNVSGNSNPYGYSGGGLFVSGDLQMQHCIIADNAGGGGGGGGIFLETTAASLRNCAISRNTGGNTDGGGGIYLHRGGELQMVNCIVATNSTFGEGGGVRSYYPLTIVNCTFVGNIRKPSNRTMRQEVC